MRKKIIYQSQEKGCGYAAIKMALFHVSGRKEFAYLKEPIITSRAPSIADLMEYAKSYGLILSAFRVKSPDELAKNEEYPLLLVLEENRMSHMVFLYKKSRRYYFFLDPQKGKRRLTIEEMHTRFNGLFLCVTSYAEQRLEIPKPKPIPWFSKLLDALFALLPILCLSLGLVLFDYLPFYYPLGFFLLSLLSIVGGKLFKMACFRSFDRRFGSKLLLESSFQRKEAYTHYYLYKGLALSSFGQFLSVAAETAVILAIFSYRNVFFGLMLCFALLMSILICLLDSPRQKKKVEEIEEKENAFLNYALRRSDREISLLSIFASTSNLASFEMAKEGFALGASIALSCLTMAFTGQFGFESFVFYCLALHLLIQGVLNTFKAYESLEKKKKEEAYFNLHFLD